MQLWINNENVLTNNSNIVATAANYHSAKLTFEKVIDNNISTSWHTISNGDGNIGYTETRIELNMNNNLEYN